MTPIGLLASNTLTIHRICLHERMNGSLYDDRRLNTIIISYVRIIMFLRYIMLVNFMLVMYFTLAYFCS